MASVGALPIKCHEPTVMALAGSVNSACNSRMPILGVGREKEVLNPSTNIYGKTETKSNARDPPISSAPIADYHITLSLSNCLYTDWASVADLESCCFLAGGEFEFEAQDDAEASGPAGEERTFDASVRSRGSESSLEGDEPHEMFRAALTCPKQLSWLWGQCQRRPVGHSFKVSKQAELREGLGTLKRLEALRRLETLRCLETLKPEILRRLEVFKHLAVLNHSVGTQGQVIGEGEGDSVECDLGDMMGVEKQKERKRSLHFERVWSG
ncbi:hypothetical protein B0H19DRAFT_1063085 [Mycena capillaripes]|nr:hypothetical protein B0H19DRAFT_1063085 [Mycena capillaripes]